MLTPVSLQFFVYHVLELGVLKVIDMQNFSLDIRSKLVKPWVLQGPILM